MIAMALLASMLLLPAAWAATYSVPGDYPTIGDAIANASSGDTITVDSGTYHENVVITKDITLIGGGSGAGMPTIDVDSGAGITLAADNAVVRRFRVTGGSTGIIIRDCGGVKVMECIVTGNGNGILVSGAHGAAVMNNTVTGNNNVGINVPDSSGNAIYLNVVTDNQYGIAVTGSSASNTIYMNVLSDNSGSNGLGNGIWNHWNSSMPLTYGYDGRQFSGYLGNYWGNLVGTDANSDGVFDSAVMLAENNGDHAPLVDPMPEHPAADFTSDATTGTAPLPVQFTDTSEGYPVSWLWDFGDGTTSNMQSPPHIYQNSGSYTVTLTVKNVRGEGRLVRSNYIVAGTTSTPAPTATPTPTATPEPWPSASPSPAPTQKPSAAATAAATPGMELLIGASALAAAALLPNKKR
jgi:parallel beta-helix repeat protein